MNILHAKTRAQLVEKDTIEAGSVARKVQEPYIIVETRLWTRRDKIDSEAREGLARSICSHTADSLSEIIFGPTLK